MRIVDTTAEVDLHDLASVEAYWDNGPVNALYFGPKRVSREVKGAALASPAFARKLEKAAGLVQSRPLAVSCAQKIDRFASDTGFSIGDQTLYLVLGCATTPSIPCR